MVGSGLDVLSCRDLGLGALGGTAAAAHEHHVQVGAEGTQLLEGHLVAAHEPV